MPRRTVVSPVLGKTSVARSIVPIHSHDAKVAIVIPEQAHRNAEDDGASAIAYLNR
jgi:hypothetical protein